MKKRAPFSAVLRRLAPAAAVVAALLVLAVAGAPDARAQTAPGGGGGGFVIKNITPQEDTTPDFQVANAKAKPFQPGKWLAVEVEFSAPPPGAPELKLKYFVLLGGQLLTGEVTHVNVPPGPSLYSVMYVAPRSLIQLLKGQPFTVNSVANAEVQILRPGVAVPVATKQLKPGPPPSGSSLPPVAGQLLNKNETPYAPLYYDRYEAIKAGK